jgi:hypothetical protein
VQLEVTPLAGEPFAAVVEAWDSHEPLGAAAWARIGEALHRRDARDPGQGRVWRQLSTSC